MLSKKELQEKYDQYERKFIIRKDRNEYKLCSAYLSKAHHDLEVARLLAMVSSDVTMKEQAGILSDATYHDWVIVASYYSMYLAATAALARISIKASTHAATILAFEYHYFIQDTLIDRKFLEIIRNAGLSREDAQKFHSAMKGREAVQYTIAERYGEREAGLILKDAKEFVNRIHDSISPTQLQ